MKKIRFGWLSSINVLIISILALLGCSGCDEVMVMYGFPQAPLDVSGEVTNTDQEPLDSIEITLRTDGYTEGVTLTDTMGKYAETLYTFPVDSIWIIATDIKQSRLTPYANHSVRVKFNPNCGDGYWN